MRHQEFGERTRSDRTYLGWLAVSLQRTHQTIDDSRRMCWDSMLLLDQTNHKWARKDVEVECRD